jgi:hypothetical protein
MLFGFNILLPCSKKEKITFFTKTGISCSVGSASGSCIICTALSGQIQNKDRVHFPEIDKGNPPIPDREVFLFPALPSPCFPPAGLAFSQKFPEAPEVLFFSKPEFLIQMSPVFGRIMVHPVRRYSERVGHDYREYFRTGFWSLWLDEGISKTAPRQVLDTCAFPEYAGF